MTTNFLEQLNPAQRESVESVDGPVLIVAGPGSGKTRVITNRIAHLVLNKKVSPYNIGAVTFTNKASREMKDRLLPLLGNEAKILTVGTFHSFCSMILRRSGEYLGLSNNFVIYDDDDQISAIKQSMKDVDVDPKQFNPRTVLSTISNSKSQLVNFEGFNSQKSNYYEEVVSKIFERYDEILSQGSALDFDDLLLKTHQLLTEFKDAAKIYQNKFHYFMVDEFQDTNIAQYSIAKIISETSRNLCVVGDPDQSIYSWRNADIRNILSFQSDFPEAKILPLEQNYRSSQNILDAAKNIITKNAQRVDKNLWTTNQKGSLISIDEAYDEEEEARKVIKEIQGHVDNDDHSLSDFAVMYRVNAQSRSFEMACQRFGVPYQIVGGIKFYHRREIKDITSYLRLILNSEDDISLSRIVNVPPRGIGQRTLSEVNRIARQNNKSLYESIISITSGDNVSHQLGNRAMNSLNQFISCIDQLKNSATNLDIMQLIDLTVSETGYRKYLETDENAEERMENVQEYRNSSREYSSVPALEGLVGFLEGISLISDIDTFEEEMDSITLIT
ncbi:MAG: AAA family ATPase, partial [SAR202 cluster bacterium]